MVMSLVMDALFLGGHPALDFLNSVFGTDDRRVEAIGNGHAFIAWLTDAALLDADEARAWLAAHDAKTLDAVAAAARDLREQARGWTDAWRSGAAIDVAARLNPWLARGGFFWRVDAAGGIAARPLSGHPDALLALVAYPVAQFLTVEDPALTRTCDGAGCTLHFVDRSNAHRRRFCSAAACGNRAKAAAFRHRRQAR